LTLSFREDFFKALLLGGNSGARRLRHFLRDL
jgi:hypothetical protein